LYTMRVIVTGAAGFIGQHLAARLLKESDMDVTHVVRTSDSSSTNLRNDAIAVDLSVPGWTRRLPAGVDVVVHLAQSRQHRSFPQGASDVYQVNVNATFELLEWARAANVRKFIFASTGSVYRPQPRRLTEDDATHTNSFYAASKIAGEMFCSAYGGQFDVTILRLFGAYGPGPSTSVLPRLMRMIANGETITLDGGLGLLTTPVYVSDCADAMMRCIRATENRGAVRVLNICGDEEVSLRDACAILGELLGREPVLLANDRLPSILSGNNTRAKELLGWSPRYGLRDGLAALCRGA
jgi:nucleoside-diphosphate-sugar epimerase